MFAVIVTVIFAWAILGMGVGATTLAINAVIAFTTAITGTTAVVLGVVVALAPKQLAKIPTKRVAKRLAEHGVVAMDVCVFAAII